MRTTSQNDLDNLVNRRFTASMKISLKTEDISQILF